MERQTMWKIMVGILIFTVVIAILTTVPGLPVNTNNAWIGYYGSILGGLITLQGVRMTIEDNKKQKEEEMRFSVIPIFKINVEAFSGRLEGEENAADVCEKDYKGNRNHAGVILRLKNIGINLATDVDIYLYSDNKLCLDKGANISTIYANEETHEKNIGFDIEDDKEISHSLKLVLKYKDIFENKYEQLCTMNYNSSCENNGERRYSIENLQINKAKHEGKHEDKHKPDK